MAQLDNAADSDSEDRGFESLRAGQEISRLTEAGDFFLKRRDSKDERDRATVRWTVATASDQAPAGARIAIPSSGPKIPFTLVDGILLFTSYLFTLTSNKV